MVGDNPRRGHFQAFSSVATVDERNYDASEAQGRAVRLGNVGE